MLLILAFFRIVKNLHFGWGSLALLGSVVVILVNLLFCLHVNAISSVIVVFLMRRVFGTSLGYHVVHAVVLRRHKSWIIVHLRWHVVGMRVHGAVRIVPAVLLLLHMFFIWIKLVMVRSAVGLSFNEALHSLAAILILGRSWLLLLTHILRYALELFGNRWSWSRPWLLLSELWLLWLRSIMVTIWLHWHAIGLHVWWLETKSWILESVRIHLVRVWLHALLMLRHMLLHVLMILTLVLVLLAKVAVALLDFFLLQCWRLVLVNFLFLNLVFF